MSEMQISSYRCGATRLVPEGLPSHERRCVKLLGHSGDHQAHHYDGTEMVVQRWSEDEESAQWGHPPVGVPDLAKTLERLFGVFIPIDPDDPEEFWEGYAADIRKEMGW